MRSVVKSLALTLLLFAGFSSGSEAQTALHKMAAVFQGGYSETQIKQELDRALTEYGRQGSESEYGHIGSVLVKMRQTTGVPEMDILVCAISAHPEGVKIDLVDMIANCAAALELQ